MNLWRPVERLALTPEVEANVARITEIWRTARERFGKGGPFLFGRFGAADAMFAPVATRFHTYDIALRQREPRLYRARSTRTRPSKFGAMPRSRKRLVIAQDEVDWPRVKKLPEAAA